MQTVIFDMDGTLANIDERRKYIEKTPKDWNSFNTKLETDTPNLDICELARLYHGLGLGYEIVICSGRFEATREQTTKQLKLWQVPFKELFLREDGNFDSDDIVKKRMLDNLRFHGYDVKIAVDDRDQVVAMWRKNGIRCLQVDYGNF